MTSKHILIIPSWFSRSATDGVFIREHARMTRAEGHQVGCIFLERGGVFSGRRTEWWEEDGISYGVMNRWHPPKVMALMSMWKRQYLKFFRAYVKRFGIPDVIHAHGYLAGIVAHSLSQRGGIPFIITEHTTAVPAQSVDWYHRSAMQRAYHEAAALIAVSTFLKLAMREYCERNDVHVIGNPVDFNRFIPSTAGARPDQLICIASLEARKNISLLLQAVALVSKEIPINLVVIGTGSQFIRLKQEAESLGLSEQIVWMGDQPQSVVLAELQRSALLLSTSTLETFGVTLVEALACGVPVVSTRSGGPEEIITEETGILVPQNDVPVLATAIREILQGHTKLHQDKIRESARRRFDFPVIAEQVERVYREVLST